MSAPAPLDLTLKCQALLLHCGRPMLCVATRSSWVGAFPDGATHLATRHVCRPCGATVELALVEPDQPVVGPGRVVAGGQVAVSSDQLVGEQAAQGEPDAAQGDVDQLVRGDQADG